MTLQMPCTILAGMIIFSLLIFILKVVSLSESRGVCANLGRSS